jgi:hypothetical protein
MGEGRGKMGEGSWKLEVGEIGTGRSRNYDF